VAAVEPYTKKTNGRQFGNAAAAAEICGIKWETYQWYVRTGRPEGHPAPGPDHVDNKTRQSMYALKAVREWNDSRPGRGNWGGIGARARKPKDEGGEQASADAAYDTGFAEAGGDTSESPAEQVDA
jgi:hypothetical protein